MVTGLQGHRDGGYYFRAAFRRKWENVPKLRKTPPKPATRSCRKSAEKTIIAAKAES